MTPEDLEELNRRISELREPMPHGPLPEPILHQSNIYAHYSPKQAWHWRITYAIWEPRDWTGDESASAVLLDEMPEPAMSFGPISRRWGCTPRECNSDDGPYIDFVWHEDRKVCIAQAWLAWKEQQ